MFYNGSKLWVQNLCFFAFNITRQIGGLCLACIRYMMALSKYWYKVIQPLQGFSDLSKNEIKKLNEIQE